MSTATEHAQHTERAHDAPSRTATPSRKVPRAALSFAGGPWQFGKSVDGGKTIPVSLVARSSQPINHWYFGPCVHDLAGMQRDKDRLTLDYVHDANEVIGYADKFDVTAEGLQVSGELVPYQDGDRASEIAFKHAAGVPYESSMFFDEPVEEFVPAGKTRPCNGQEMAGPLTIFRQWRLRGIALCPYGTDAHTPIKMAADDLATITTFQEEQSIMPDPTKPAAEAKPTEQAAADAAPPQAPPAATLQAAAPPPYDRKAEGAKFTTAFGDDRGAKYFAAGLSLEEAQAKFSAEIVAENATLKTKLAASVSALGEEAPLSGGPAPNAAEQQAALSQAKYGSGLGKFIAGIQMPGAKTN